MNDRCIDPCMMDDRDLGCDVPTGRCVEPDTCVNDEQCFWVDAVRMGPVLIHVSIMLIVLVVSDAMTVVNVWSL